MRHQLVCLLGRGVKTDRVVDVLIFGEGQDVVCAIHAGAGRVDEVRDLTVAAALEDVAERRQVVGDVGLGVDQRIAHAGLRREMDDATEAAGFEKLSRRARVGKVETFEPEFRQPLKAGDPRLFQLDVVIGIEIVDARDDRAFGAQALRHVHSDKPGGAGHQHAQARERQRIHGARPCAPRSASARNLAYFMKLLWQPIAMCTKPGTPSRNPSLPM